MSSAVRTTGKLEIHAASDREVVMTRVFDAPRRLVYDAVTKPELVRRWLGVFGKHTMSVCEIDLRVGGKYRYVWSTPNAPDMGMGGVYKEIVPQEKIVSTEKFDQSWYPGEALDTLVLTEKGGKTTMVTTMRYDSKEARDAVLKSPMDTGVAASYDTLDAVLASLR
jgi:uncharacterized protein YndB with AHSA1/START domain